ncbi:hypothetical protein E4U36_003169 [Claviceps purpurea]|nr:hypothetical protein E4U36_003169 [Claviceps purpurea]
MVKILSIFLATLAAFSPVAQAGDCTPGVSYCGSTLQRYGFPGAGKLNPDDLYNCVSPKKVRRMWTCRIGCADRGVGEWDNCRQP